MQSRQRKIAAAEAKLMQKQANEVQALRKRIDAGENEQRKQRALELERLLQRYQNVKKELEMQQRLEKQRLQKGSKQRPGTASRSTLGSPRSRATPRTTEMKRYNSRGKGF